MNNIIFSHQVPSEDSNNLQFLRCSLLFIFLVGIYSLTYSGTFRVDDEHILTARAQSFAFRGHLDYPQIYGNDRVRHLSEILEDSATPVVAIEPGQALLGSLYFRLASIVDLDGVQTFFTLNLYATALTGVLVFLIVCGLGFRSNTAIATSLLFGVGTMAWPYSKTAFRDPLAMMFVTIGFWGWVLLLKREKSRFVGAGLLVLGIGCGVLVKSNVLFTIPALILSSIVITRGKSRGAIPPRHWLIISPMILALIVALVAVFLPGMGPFSRLSLANYTASIQRYLQGINRRTFLAIVGPLVSPAKSIFLFNPILFFVPMAIRGAWSKMKNFALPTLFSTLFLILAQALHLGEQWAGTLLWGLRFTLPILPLLVVLIAPFIEDFFTMNWNWKKMISSVVIVAAFMVQLAGAIVAWRIPYEQWQKSGLNAYGTKTVWDFSFQVIPIHFRHLADPGAWDIAWLRILAYDSQVMILPMVFVIAISLCLVGLVWIRSADRRKKNFVRVLSTLTVLILIFPIFPSLWFYKSDPLIGGQQPEFMSLVSWAEEQVENGDLVIVDSYGTELWRMMMGEWDVPIPWYSLPYEIPGAKGVGWIIGGPPSSATLDLLSGLSSKYNRLIYLTSDGTPDYSLMREQLWLGDQFAETESVHFQGMAIAEGYIFLP